MGFARKVERWQQKTNSSETWMMRKRMMMRNCGSLTVSWAGPLFQPMMDVDQTEQDRPNYRQECGPPLPPSDPKRNSEGAWCCLLILSESAAMSARPSPL